MFKHFSQGKIPGMSIHFFAKNDSLNWLSLNLYCTDF